MSTRNSLWVISLILSGSLQAAKLEVPQLGKAASQTLIDQWNLDVFPDGSGLPAGTGSAAQGEKLYRDYCQNCHGNEGQGGSAEELAGAKHGLQDKPPDKTIGTYWPYATTLFDFIRRSMPLDKPGVLNNEQLYAVTAYLLYLNKLYPYQERLDAAKLGKVQMSNRRGFVDSYTKY